MQITLLESRKAIMNHEPCGDQWDECCDIVDRLKKRIKILTTEIDMLTEKYSTCDTTETLRLIDLGIELQKILDSS